MGFFKRKREDRTDPVNPLQLSDTLIQALLGDGVVDREMALQVPTVSGGIDLIAGIVAETPIKLYRENGGKTEEVTDDARVRLLNDETGDTLNANEFWHAMVRDYYVGKGGYAYINRPAGEYESLHYVDERHISILKNTDPIFKDYDICVDGIGYHPYNFFRILRNTRDGMQGVPITTENRELIGTAYALLVLEHNVALRGGNKKGFLQSANKIEDSVLRSLRSAFAKLYSGSNSDNFVVLNKGIEFKEASDTAVEMQLNENKASNAEEFAKIFHVSTPVMSGKGSDADISSLAKLAAIPLMCVIQCSLNRDLLLEKEKSSYYWAFDTKELLKGTMKERFDAYKVGLDGNFLQIDEVRYKEDLPPLGLSWIKLGLNDVLYDPATKTIYTPNTNKLTSVGENSAPHTGTEEASPADPAQKITAADARSAAADVANKTLNGAQTQSLITVIQQYQAGGLTLQQAVNIIAVSIGISKEEATDLIGAAAKGGEE